MATAKAPTKLTIRAYQVGFGDCFLLTWHYRASERHVLIDFGSNGRPEDVGPNMLTDIAEDIGRECNGRLDAVVLTHRHKDHIAGFATASDGNGPGDIIRKLRPRLVVQPWTEDPRAAPNATAPTSRQSARELFVNALGQMQAVSAGVAAEAASLATRETSASRRGALRALEFLGEEGIQNLAAVKNLQAMGAAKGSRSAYVSHESPSGLERMLPGVRVTVLGPPTLQQTKDVLTERSKDAAEFWMLRAAAGQVLTGSAAPPFPRAAKLSSRRPPPYARWLIPRLREVRAQNLLQIVRIMDDALNNTSVILLFEVGRQSFLFPGDAQIENWQYTLKQKPLMKRLAKVTFYKVGHHGSRNATPKSLWNNFARRGPKSDYDRLVTVVSTMAEKYGKLAEGTEVPRTTLVKALKAESQFFSTQQLRGEQKQTFEFAL
jgi:hypothetical protein